MWDSVKFSFEIEEVSAAVFWKETAKVNVIEGNSHRVNESLSGIKFLFGSVVIL